MHETFTGKAPRRAAQYVRMSTDMQRYSIQNQSETITAFALVNGFQIVRYYADEGKSGLTIRERSGLQSLLDDVGEGRADFEVLLVYDVSRWGRFQNIDESAYYEHACRLAGVEVIYCAETFENDGTLLAAILKTLKRGMAAEYSRDLSEKVLRGQTRLIREGFRQGGVAGYGLRRQLIDSNGTPKFELKSGDRKSLQTDRVVLVPGPAEEVAVVREIYQLFIDGMGEAEIARTLTARGLTGEDGCPWTRDNIQGLLTNAKYAGHSVRNRTTGKLGARRHPAPTDQWVRLENAFPAVVSQEVFDKAQLWRTKRKADHTNHGMLVKLRKLLDETGALNNHVIEGARSVPTVATYQRRFGGLRRAYDLIDHRQAYEEVNAATNSALRRLRPKIARTIVADLEERGIRAEIDSLTGMVHVNDALIVRIMIGRFNHAPHNNQIWWWFGWLPKLPADIIIAIKMDTANQHPNDYHLLDRAGLDGAQLSLSRSRCRMLKTYRFAEIHSLPDQLGQRVSGPSNGPATAAL